MKKGEALAILSRDKSLLKQGNAAEIVSKNYGIFYLLLFTIVDSII